MVQYMCMRKLCMCNNYIKQNALENIELQALYIIQMYNI